MATGKQVVPAQSSDPDPCISRSSSMALRSDQGSLATVIKDKRLRALLADGAAAAAQGRTLASIQQQQQQQASASSTAGGSRRGSVGPGAPDSAQPRSQEGSKAGGEGGGSGGSDADSPVAGTGAATPVAEPPGAHMRRVLLLASQIAAGMAYLHERNILHGGGWLAWWRAWVLLATCSGRASRHVVTRPLVQSCAQRALLDIRAPRVCAA